MYSAGAIAILLAVIGVSLVNPPPCWAYVDPNTVGFVSQILTPLATLLVAGLIYFRRKVGGALLAGWRLFKGRLPEAHSDEEVWLKPGGYFFAPWPFPPCLSPAPWRWRSFGMPESFSRPARGPRSMPAGRYTGGFDRGAGGLDNRDFSLPAGAGWRGAEQGGGQMRGPINLVSARLLCRAAGRHVI